MRALAVAAAALVLAAEAAAGIHVQGNRLVDDAGRPVRLLGVNRSGTEFACAQGWGLFDGPATAASVAAMAAWRIDAVRVPLNEDCWLGLNGIKPRYSGLRYRTAVAAYVQLLHAAGLAVVLDLHWNAPGKKRAVGQQPMPDADHSVAFWRSVARAFRADHDLVFDLYNEPHDVSWKCWRDGCGPWVGMQRLVTAVRAVGATQPLMLGGLGWAGDLSQWLRWQPKDPLHQLVASLHLYDFGGCTTQACWNGTVEPVAAVVPVVTGELGETDCGHSFIDAFMPWADAAGISYIGWAWNTWSCGRGPALISSYDGTPTAFGVGFRDHLAALATAPSP